MNNWYKDYLNERMEKEASLKQGVMISLISMLSGVSAWFEASHIRDFLDKRNIPYEQFENTVNAINNTNKEFDDLDKSDIILAKQNIDTEYKSEMKNPFNQNNTIETRESLTPFDIIARTIYDEARGEGYEGMKLVADTILNRSNGTSESMKNACLKPWQYAGWNNGKILPQGNGNSWEISKKLAQDILDPNSQYQKNDVTNFVNPRLLLKDRNINIPPIREPEDLLGIPDEYLKHFPTFMFKPIKVPLNNGAWKYTYPKEKNNLRTDFNILGDHVTYS